jgi:hypothetical protein
VTYEVQIWSSMFFMALAKGVPQEIAANSRLERHLDHFCSILVLDLDARACVESQRLRRL